MRLVGKPVTRVRIPLAPDFSYGITDSTLRNARSADQCLDHASPETHTLVGVFLLLFGLKWLHKAILRSSGLKSLHDEAKTFEETKEMLVASGASRAGVDKVGGTTSGCRRTPCSRP
jgi:hypothetical protein